MKKRMFLTLLLPIVLLLAGCATQVSVQRLVPAKYSMADYRELTVLSVKPYRFYLDESPSLVVKDLSGSAPFKVLSGYGAFFERDLANHLDKKLREKINRLDYFTLNENSRQGYLDVEVKRLEADEYVWGKKSTNEDGEEETLFYLQQKLRLEIAFSMVDAKSGLTVYSDTYQERQEFSYLLDPEKGPTIYAPDLSPILKDMGERLISELVDSIAPRWETIYLYLMDNKPKIKSLEAAYKAVEEGRLTVAYDLFLKEYNNSSHLGAGYNAALILEALQSRDEAIELMERVYRGSASAKVKKQLERMVRYRQEQSEAEQQY